MIFINQVGINLPVIAAMDALHKTVTDFKAFRAGLVNPDEFTLLNFLDAQVSYNPAERTRKPFVASESSKTIQNIVKDR